MEREALKGMGLRVVEVLTAISLTVGIGNMLWASKSTVEGIAQIQKERAAPGGRFDVMDSRIKYHEERIERLEEAVFRGNEKRKRSSAVLGGLGLFGLFISAFGNYQLAKGKEKNK